MALDKLVDSAQLDADLTTVANAIRTKGGTSAQLAFPSGFASAIAAIPSGGGTYQAKTGIDPTTSSQTIQPDSGFDALSSVQINAMPSGTAGTPTATKGTVSNHSVSVTPSVTNTTGYITGSTKTGTAVTVSASELVSGSETKTANGTYDVTNLAELVVDVSGGGGGSSAAPKQVNFIDYDGKILYSYSASEAQALTDLPANPSHAGLTAQGWNWTLAQIKAQLTAMPDAPVWAGQMYVTQSGDTEIDVRFAESKRLSPILTIAVNGTITVDWGDGTTASTVTGSSLSTRKDPSHTYASGGDYTIKIHVSSGNFRFYGGSGYEILRRNTTASNNRIYSNAVVAVRFGSGVTQIGDYAFQNCNALCYVTIPSTVTSIGTYVFQNCYSLKNITVPTNVTTIGEYFAQNSQGCPNFSFPNGITSIGKWAFQACYTLRSITIPGSVTSIGEQAFRYNYTAASFTIPASVTSIGAQAFDSCINVKEYHVLRSSPPTLSNSNAFGSIASDCVIYVPSASLNTYKSTSNWSSYSSKMQGE